MASYSAQGYSALLPSSAKPVKEPESGRTAASEDTGHGMHRDHEAEVAILKQEEDRILQRLDDLDKFWSARTESVAAELADLDSRRLEALMEKELLHHHDDDDGQIIHPSGPMCLNFLDKPLFTCLSSCVIVFNVFIMIMEKLEGKSSLYWYLDQVFLLWYTLELSMRAVYHREGLLIGRLRVVWWNWLDLLVVAAGVMDQWIMPITRHAGISALGESHHNFNQFMRLLRLVRLARVVKICRILVGADFHWVEGPRFQTFIMSVIGLNAVTLGLELDIDWRGWVWVENAMLIIYTVELWARIALFGPQFFFNDDMKWNLMDFMIVSGAIIDQWLMPCIHLVQVMIWPDSHELVQGGSPVMTLLRMVRLLRVLRLVRLLHSIKPLYKLLMGVLEAMQGMKWVLVLASVVLYAFAILLTTLVGHGMLFKDGQKPEEARGLFDHVPDSMFMLFKVMNDDQSVMDPLLYSDAVKMLFVIFMIISNWSVLAILTAVVSENMISSTEKRDQEEEAEKSRRLREESIRELRTLYGEVDVNGDKTIDEGEFQAILNDEAKASRLCAAANLEARDLMDLFEYLSVYDNKRQANVIQYEMFIESTCNEGRPVCERTVFRLEKKVNVLEDRVNGKLDEAVDLLQRIKEKQQRRKARGT